MSKFVTYTGQADRYYVTDKNGERQYFPRRVGVEVADPVAKLLPKSKDFKIAASGDEAAGTAPASEERK